MNLFRVSAYDRVGISPNGTGSYINSILEAENQVEMVTLVEYFEVCVMFERML